MIVVLPSSAEGTAIAGCGMLPGARARRAIGKRSFPAGVAKDTPVTSSSKTAGATSLASRRPEARRTPATVPAACLAVYALVWGLLAIAPSYREDWLLENLPVFIVVPLFVLTYRRFRFSDRAYVQIMLFLLLHAVGSHYTYSEVPFGDHVARALDLDRNHYDRLVHFLFGVLFFLPVRELAFARGRPRSERTALVLTLACMVALSTGYELLEWAVAIVADPAAGTAFLGTQGDPWDAQKDMALAAGGALLAGLFEAWHSGRAARGRGAARGRQVST